MNSDCKIIYLYVKKYGILENVEVSFDPEYEVHYEKGCLKASYKSLLPSDFYAIDGISLQKINGLSAVVGVNASGKTSVAKLLKDILEGESVPGVVILLQKAKELICLSSIRKRIEVKSRKRIHVSRFGTDRAYACLEDISLIYLNPHNTTIDVLVSNKILHANQLSVGSHERNFVNLSTSGMLEECNRKSVDLMRKGTVPYSSPVAMFMQGEMTAYYKTLASLILDSRKKPLLKRTFLSSGLPKGIFVYPNQTIIWEALSKIKHDNADDIEKRLATLLEQEEAADFLVGTFLSYVAAYFLDVGREDLSSIVPKPSFLEELISFGERNIVSLRAKNKAAIRKTHKAIKAFLSRKAPPNVVDGKKINLTAGLFEELIPVFAAESVIERGVNSIEFNEDSFSRIINVIGIYEQVKYITDFLVFQTAPTMAAGEYSYMCLFSRLFPVLQGWGKPIDSEYYVDNESRRYRDVASHVILFIDEAETALHPELQRHLVENMLAFLESYAPEGLSIQLMFSSHSPILLSDIPQSAVTFLKNGSNRKKQVKLRMSTGTFAANIFDLYSLAFEMGNGTFGSFATNKLNRLLRMKANGVPFSTDDIKQIKMIGDNYFRNYLLSDVTVEAGR